MTPADAPLVTAWFRAHARDLPWRREGFSAWGTLVSELMLQQTQVVRVVPILEAWLDAGRRPPTSRPRRPPRSSGRGDASATRGGRSRCTPARPPSPSATATVVPESSTTLLALPGVGDYTARAVAVFAHGRRHPVVDTNVRRVLARAVDGVAQPGPPNARRDLPAMAALLPDDLAEQRLFNAGTMEIGAIVCTARAPRCAECPLAEVCAWRLAGSPAHDGPAPRRQARFEGSDRQRRGRVMAELRASDVPVTDAELAQVLPDAAVRERVLAGLVRDGLAAGTDGGLDPPRRESVARGVPDDRRP